MGRSIKRTRGRKTDGNNPGVRHRQGAVDGLYPASVLQPPAAAELRQPIWQPGLPLSPITRPVAGHDFGAVPLLPASVPPVQARAKRPSSVSGAGSGFAHPNRTGLPDHLKTGMERLSGVDLSGVRVHYNSSRPSQIHAHAYTQGRDIHIGPGQEQHLPHEGWHVVQQMQGRVRPTVQMPGVAMNNEAGLEREADVMGARVGRSGDPASVRDDTPVPGPAGSEVKAAVITAPGTSGGTGPIQAVWASVHGSSGPQLQLRTLAETDALGQQHYLHSSTGQKYVYVSGDSGSGTLVVAPIAAPPAPGPSYTSPVTPAYEDWRPSQTGNTPVATSYGPVRARHHRGAPYVTADKARFGNQAVGDSYPAYLSGVRRPGRGSKDDARIARDLLDQTTVYLAADRQKHAAARLQATVELAEQWRKHGAAKIWRAFLRLVKAGSYTLDEAKDLFKFIRSADAGRRQVGRMQDVAEGETHLSELDDDEQELYEAMSEIDDGDLSTDDETRGSDGLTQRQRKALKKKRLHAKKHNKEDDSDA